MGKVLSSNIKKLPRTKDLFLRSEKDFQWDLNWDLINILFQGKILHLFYTNFKEYDTRFKNYLKKLDEYQLPDYTPAEQLALSCLDMSEHITALYIEKANEQDRILKNYLNHRQEFEIEMTKEIDQLKEKNLNLQKQIDQLQQTIKNNQKNNLNIKTNNRQKPKIKIKNKKNS